jgi:methyl-accepting chemotaxis protein
MAGASQSFDSSGKTKAYLVKTDSGGNIQWNETYSRTAGHDYGRSMIQTSDGGYAIAGQTDYFGSGDGWLIKTDSAGNLTWDKTYDGNNSDSLVSIVQTSDRGYALAGQTDFWGSGDAWLIRTDSAGSEMWNETFGGSGYDRGCSVIWTRDGGLALSGFTNSFSSDDNYEVYVVKLGSEGTTYQDLIRQITELRAELETLDSQVANLNISYNQVLQNYSELLTRFNILNSSIQQHLQDYSRLQANLSSLTATIDNLNTTINDYKSSTGNQLTFLTNIVYSLIAITVILCAATCYLATRKPKQNDSPHENRNGPPSNS